MAYDLPSLVALQSFEAALRHGSFTRAAEELSRTQGAISRQVAQLERELGVALFHRERPRLRPTPAALVFGERVRLALERLAAATFELRTGQGEGGRLGLAVLPTFGTRWLIPRLPRFYAAHPEVNLEIATRLVTFDFDREMDLDVAIHHGRAGGWPGAKLEPLMAEWVTVVATPSLALELREPEDVSRGVLLQIVTRPYAWNEWLSAAQVSGVDGRRGPRFEHHLMVIQAALAGLGLALVPAFLVREELADGRLLEPFPRRRVRSRRAYWLAWPERNRDLPALAAFRAWLYEELILDGLADPS